MKNDGGADEWNTEGNPCLKALHEIETVSVPKLLGDWEIALQRAREEETEARLPGPPTEDAVVKLEHERGTLCGNDAQRAHRNKMMGAIAEVARLEKYVELCTYFQEGLALGVKRNVLEAAALAALSPELVGALFNKYN